MTTLVWGDLNPWHQDDPRRPCYTCGAAPVGTFSDGSPRYAATCRHTPVVGRAPGVSLGIVLDYTLTDREVTMAQSCAERQALDSVGRKDTWGDRQLSDDQKLANNYQGNAGELAFARLTGLPWRCSIRKFGRADVGPYQVRARRESWHDLPLHDSDRGKPVVLLIGQGRRFTIVGWLRDARLGMIPDYVKDPGQRRVAWFVPQDALETPLTIPELASRRVASTASGT